MIDPTGPMHGVQAHDAHAVIMKLRITTRVSEQSRHRAAVSPRKYQGVGNPKKVHAELEGVRNVDGRSVLL
eukprot:SAG11_NODE_655_length_7909_cov_7.307298_7_plen_71_part_00